jgi:predicted dehydrogenase
VNPLRIALVGAGRWGRRYVPVLLADSGFELVGVVDTSLLVRQQLLGLAPRPTRIVEELAPLVELGLDAVVVATPSVDHARTAELALGWGLHVLIEKPFATTPTDADRIVRAARAARRTLLVGHLPLHHPQIVELLGRAHDSGESSLRSEHVRTSRGAESTSESALWALAPHDVAIALRLHRCTPRRVRVTSAAIDEQMLEAVAEFDGGGEARFSWSRRSAHPTRRVRVEGRTFVALADETADSRSSPQPRVDPLTSQCTHFLRACRGSEAVTEGAEQGRATVLVLAALERSRGLGGQWVELECEPGPHARRMPPAMNADGAGRIDVAGR